MLHLDISSAAPSPKTYLVETADESMAPGKGDDYAYSGNFLWKHGGPVTLDSKELELLNQERLRDSAGLSEELEQGDDYSNRWWNSNRWNSMLHSMGDDYRRELAQEVVRPPYWW